MPNDSLLIWPACVALAYLLGSVPFGLLIGLTKGVDIREHGSGNLGATNLGRTLGKRWGVGCFFLDMGKGLAPVVGYGAAFGLLGGAAWEGDQPVLTAITWLGVAVAAVAGHIFPIYLKFKGGKGVATGLGVVLGFFPFLTVAGLAAFVVWVVTLKATGYVALASILGALALPAFSAISGYLFGLPVGVIGVFAAVTALLALLVVVRHRTNIARLLDGTEHSFKKKAQKKNGDAGPEARSV